MDFKKTKKGKRGGCKTGVRKRENWTWLEGRLDSEGARILEVLAILLR